MDTQFIKQLLDTQFYSENKQNLSRSLFDDDILELYDVIVSAHNKFGADLTPDELFALWQAENPVATKSVVSNMADVIKKIDSEQIMNKEVAANLLASLWRRKTGERIANLGIAMSEGKSDAFDRLVKLVEKSRDGFLPTDFGDETTKDLDILLSLTSDDARFKFNIPALSRVCYGIGRQEFGILFARPETGKTALAVSLGCAPNGFADQGRKFLYLGNEEKTERTMLRAYQAWTGMTKEEIVTASHLARERFEAIEDKVDMMQINGWNMLQVDAYLEKMEPDVVMVDQGDKVGVDGNFGANHEKLREVYTQGRELFKKHDCAGFFVSQASADAEGKTVVTPDMMEGSKTGKYAEADLIIGVGKYPDPQDGSPNEERFLTLGKNKLSGWHGTIPAKLEGEISRYVD